MFTERCNTLAAKISSDMKEQSYKQTYNFVNIYLQRNEAPCPSSYELNSITTILLEGWFGIK